MAEAFLAIDLLDVMYDVFEDEDDLDEIEEQTILRRTIRDSTNPFDCPERSFRSYFRLSRELTQQLCNWLRPVLERNRCHGLPVEKQVLAALRFDATGSNQGCVGQDINIAFSQPSVSRAIHAVTKAINATLLRDFIKFPQTVDERCAAKQKFETAPQPFFGAIGAIDCTHVAIIAPKEHEEDHINHHEYHSLNVQMVCDPSFKILQVCARYGGSRHDAFIWNASPLRRLMLENYAAGERSTWLLGDSGYPLEPWLLTPIPHAAPDTPDFRYTSAHCKARSVIERCFGILKGVWGCLSKKRVLLYDPVTAGRIVNVCAILHNLRLSHNMEAEEDEVEEQEGEPYTPPPPGEAVPEGRHRLAEATRIRERLIACRFS